VGLRWNRRRSTQFRWNKKAADGEKQAEESE